MGLAVVGAAVAAFGSSATIYSSQREIEGEREREKKKDVQLISFIQFRNCCRHCRSIRFSKRKSCRRNDSEGNDDCAQNKLCCCVGRMKNGPDTHFCWAKSLPGGGALCGENTITVLPMVVVKSKKP